MFTYKTLVRIDPSILKDEVENLRKSYIALDPTFELRKSKEPQYSEIRSAFSRFNNLNHFYQRLMQMETPKNNIPIKEKRSDGTLVIEVVASAKGNSARIYFKPSVTSLTKEVRKAIKPIDDNNVFVYFDLKAAEFALRCIQAQDNEALKVYYEGGDIYMAKAHLFPQGTERPLIKKTLIASMYGRTAYSTAKDLGISETQAQRLLDNIDRNFTKLTMLKRSIVLKDKKQGAYYSPDGFDQTHLIKVADINPAKGFDPNLAWSAWTQSALGFIMQKFSTMYLNHQKDSKKTFLSIFDSVVAEVSKENVVRFQDYCSRAFSPLLPDGFHQGSTMYEALYEN